jgi:hypothetical protein
MFGLIILIAIYVFLGFLLAWIAQMVAREEVSIGTGVLTLVCAGVANFFIGMGLEQALGESVVTTVLQFVSGYIVFVMCLKAIAKLEWKHSAIIAAIYQVVIFLILFGLASCTA